MQDKKQWPTFPESTPVSLVYISGLCRLGVQKGVRPLFPSKREQNQVAGALGFHNKTGKAQFNDWYERMKTGTEFHIGDETIARDFTVHRFRDALQHLRKKEQAGEPHETWKFDPFLNMPEDELASTLVADGFPQDRVHEFVEFMAGIKAEAYAKTARSSS